MKKFLIPYLCLAVALLAGCNSQNLKVDNPNNVAVSNYPDNANSEMPPTEKEDDKYVSSETGTEKAKPEAGKANVQGKVLYNGSPVPNVEVKICQKFNNFIGGCSGDTYKSKTDANGEYLIANITPGIYEGLLVQVFNTKDYIFATKNFGIGNATYNFEADKTFFVRDTNLFKADLKIQNPKAGGKMTGKDFELKWDAYPQAAYYKVSVLPDDYASGSSFSQEKVAPNMFKPIEPLKSGKYRIKVEAFNDGDVKLADNGDYLEINVIDGDAPAGNSKHP